jgi:hypothetical protein
MPLSEFRSADDSHNAPLVAIVPQEIVTRRLPTARKIAGFEYKNGRGPGI